VAAAQVAEEESSSSTTATLAGSCGSGVGARDGERDLRLESVQQNKGQVKKQFVVPVAGPLEQLGS
jgi:carbon monoxide dehydrogenase subunit G